jgi:hypothetical protein
MSSFTELLKDLYFSYLSKPAGDRQLYRHVRRQPFARFVEIGLTDLGRTQRLVALAQRLAPEVEIQYTGIDMFEGREADSDGPSLTLKGTHQSLKAVGAKVKLVPGDAYSALARTANSLSNIDLVLISAVTAEDTYQQASFYLPRMLHESSRVFREVTRDDEANGDAIKVESHWEQISLSDIEQSSHSSRRAA